MLMQDIIDDIDIVKSILHTSEADVSDIDGTVNVEQGLIQLELEIGRTYPERHKIVSQVEEGWHSYRNRQEPFGPVVHAAIAIIPELFRGLKRDDVAKLSEFVVQREASKMYAFPQALFRVLRGVTTGARGRHLLLAITGSPHDLALPMCKRLGFDAVVGSYYLVDNQGRYTGERDERPARDKGAVMDELSERCGISWEHGIALGDSPTDIPMFERCACRLAINPTIELQQWMREHPELEVVWVNDHQKTGSQLMKPNFVGLYRETALIEVLPHHIGMVMKQVIGGHIL